MGAAVKMDVAVDGRLLGQTAANTYFYTDVAPGKHTITSKSENTDTLEFEAIAGKLYYVWQEVKMGVLYARTKLNLVSPEVGRKGVLETKLASSQGSAQPAGPGSSYAAASAEKRPSAGSGDAGTNGVESTGVPYLAARGQERFREFLKKPLPRAFAISDTGYSVSVSGMHPQNPNDPTDPKERALKLCKQFATKDCVLYMIDNDIVMRSCGASAKGPRWYEWAYLPARPEAGFVRGLLVRRHRRHHGERAYYLTHAPVGTPLEKLVEVAGCRWTIESAFAQAKGEVGLDQYEVRRYDAWYRHVTLAMLAHAYLAVVRAHSAGKKHRSRTVARALATDRARSAPAAGGVHSRMHTEASDHTGLVAMATPASAVRQAMPLESAHQEAK